MKKRLSMILAAVAMLATGSASLGCPWFLSDEPDSCHLFYE